ncbi:MAG: archaeosortase/exosortase family protein [Candidatus Micrarchaeota archaeon]|nr:archaeosortase/exosortase family protein [Candidatus Micrarchaeota archaeon]
MSLPLLGKIGPGQKRLLLRLAAFAVLYLLVVPLAMAAAATLLDKKVSFTLNFDRSAVFLLLLLGFFVLKNRGRLLGLEHKPPAQWEPFLFGAFSAVAFSWYFLLRYFMPGNFVLQNFGTVVLASYGAYLLASVALWLAVFGIDFTAGFAGMFTRELVLSLVTAAFFVEFSLALQYGWKLFSNTVTALVYHLLSAAVPGAVMALSACCAPMVGVGSFRVLIGEACSGIDSLSLFTLLFVGIMAYDWKVIDKKRALLAFVPGLVGIWFANIFRVSALVLIGAFVSPGLAVGLFHENAGWIFFVIYCTAFWYFAYPFVRARGGGGNAAQKRKIKNK